MPQFPPFSLFSVWDSNLSPSRSWGRIRNPILSPKIFISQTWHTTWNTFLSTFETPFGDAPHVPPWNCYRPKCHLCIRPQSCQATPKKCHSLVQNMAGALVIPKGITKNSYEPYLVRQMVFSSSPSRIQIW